MPFSKALILRAKAIQYWKPATFLIFFIIFLLSRIIYLDADIPIFRLLFISGPDELFWNISGFNLYKYGCWVHKVFDFLPPDELPFTSMQNFMTFLGLKLFGNNFYGLRISSAVCGAIVAVCVIYALNKQTKEDRPEKLLSIFLISIYMLFDFFFLESNRFNEPTIYSMAMIALAMTVLASTDQRYGKITYCETLACGLLAGFSITFVYIYNVYWVAALAGAVFLSRYKDGRRQVLIHSLIFTLGILISIGAFLIFLHIAFSMSLDYYIALMKGIGGRGTNRVPQMSNLVQFTTLISNNYKTAFEQFFNNNLFRYNPALLFLFLATMPVFVVKTIREQRSIDIFIILFFIFRIALSILIPYDWYEKKLVQIFPCVVYIIGAAIIYAHSVLGNFSKRKNKLIFSAYILLVIVFGFLTYRVMNNELSNSYRPIEFIAKYEFFAVLLVFPLVLIQNLRLKKLVLIILLFIVVLPNLRLSNHYVYGHPTYQRRDALISMGQKIDGKILAGGVSFAVRLYNTSIPVLNFYNYYYYGADKYNKLSKRLYQSGGVSGAIFFTPLPTDPQHFLAPTINFIKQGGLILDSEYDLGEEDNLKYGLFLIPRN
jgi:hypothetical protein